MNPKTLVRELDAALTRFEWTRVEELCTSLVAAVRVAKTIPAVVPQALSSLRRKRRYSCMARLAEALIHADHGTPFVRRQYAQALIDQGMLVAAELALRNALQDAGSTQEAFEIQGLLGRVLKQWYVTSPPGRPQRDRDTLQRAIDWYMGAYKANPRRNYWHGINVVALVKRGRRDSVSVSAGVNVSTIASDILKNLKKSATPRAKRDPWEVATALEALLALGRYDQLRQRAREYATHPGARPL